MNLLLIKKQQNLDYKKLMKYLKFFENKIDLTKFLDGFSSFNNADIILKYITELKNLNINYYILERIEKDDCFFDYGIIILKNENLKTDLIGKLKNYNIPIRDKINATTIDDYKVIDEEPFIISTNASKFGL